MARPRHCPSSCRPATSTALGNRGSLLYDFTFFLLGLHLAPQIRCFLFRVTVPVAALLVACYLAAFGAMRLTGTESLPGVWLFVSMAGVTMGLAAAPTVSRIPAIGRGSTWLGERTLPIYVIHMPLVAIADDVLHERLSGARVSVRQTAAVALPVEGLRFHDLRRTNLTALVLDGADPKTVQARAGHSDPRLTLAVYAQATTEGDRRAADLLGQRFLPNMRAVTTRSGSEPGNR